MSAEDRDDVVFEDGPLIDGVDRLPEEVFGAPEPSARFRETLLLRTSGVVRRRRLRRRFLRIAGVAAVFLLGVWSGRALDGDPVAPRAAPTSAPSAGEPVRSSDAALAALPENPLALDETIAVASPAQRAELLRRAGDGYLSGDRMDPEAALYCYRQLLAQSPEETRAEPQPGDSWLLVQLKLATQDGDRR